MTSLVEHPVASDPYVVTAYLHVRISDIKDLPPGEHLVRLADTADFKPFNPATIPRPKLLSAISEGRVYALWGFNRKCLAELDPSWSVSTAPVRPG